MKNKKVSKWWYLAALFMFVAATFQIADNHFIFGAIFICCATCFASAARICQKGEKEEERQEIIRKQGAEI